MHKICRKYRKKLAIVKDIIIIVNRPAKGQSRRADGRRDSAACGESALLYEGKRKSL